MATILVTWELGGGWGHLVPLRPIIDGLARRGHSVVAAVRNVARAGYALADSPARVRLLQAPHRAGAVRDPIREPHTFAQILPDAGWADEIELRAVARAWRTVLECVEPDLLIADHSPTALLASRGLAVRRAVAGFGFICPPDQDPLPNLRFWTRPDPQAMARADAAVLGRMNGVLDDLGQPPIDRVTRIYGDADATFLTTFKELDHFPWRGAPQSAYFGPWTRAEGKAPPWPAGSGPRIYVYLKDCPALPNVLRWLAGSGNPALAYVDTANAKLIEEVKSPTLRIEREPLDMKRVADECECAILHAPHGTTAAMLLAGRPLMMLPVFLEQALMATAVCRMGAGVQSPAADAGGVVARLEKFVSGVDGYAPAAQAFAAKYAGYDPVESNERVLDGIEEILSRSNDRADRRHFVKNLLTT